jgi:hypothetical protein
MKTELKLGNRAPVRGAWEAAPEPVARERVQ